MRIGWDGAVNLEKLVFGPGTGEYLENTYDNSGDPSKFGIGFYTNNTQRMRIGWDGKVGIGTTNLNGDYNLFVKTGIRTEKVKVDIAANNGWADFVFSPDYELMPLAEVEAFIKENQHLPEVPSAKDLEENGMDLAEMDKIQMQKIEELTLYTLEQEKKIKSLEQKNQELELRLEAIESQLSNQ